MGHQQVIGIAAGPLDSNPARAHAMVVHAFQAARAHTASDPGTNQAILPDWRMLRLRPGGHHGAERLVPECHGWMHAAVAHVETLAPAQVEVAVADVHIA